LAEKVVSTLDDECLGTHLYFCTTIAGGGARERVFWQNYFFHCAYTRYEAGLSIDEIWSFQPEKAEGEAATEQATKAVETEETVVFDGSGEAEETSAESAFPGSENAAEGDVSAALLADTDFTGINVSPSESANEFEMVDDDEAAGGSGEPELDALEAEIARELEGL
jgi:hypothetical protein